MMEPWSIILGFVNCRKAELTRPYSEDWVLAGSGEHIMIEGSEGAALRCVPVGRHELLGVQEMWERRWEQSIGIEHLPDVYSRGGRAVLARSGNLLWRKSTGRICIEGDLLHELRVLQVV
jgi:hypothetical protein